MSLRKSKLLIRDYGNIRNILRNIYIFGCFNCSDFIEMGVSGRKYDNEQRRINAYLPEKFIRKRRIRKKVQYYCRYSLDDGSDNYLAETYRNKSFTMLDITAYFWILSILNSSPGLTLNDILDRIPLINEELIYTRGRF